VKSRRSIIVVEGFYRDAQAVRNYALRQRYYTPYQDPAVVEAGLEPAKWWASWFRPFDECPFKYERLVYLYCDQNRPLRQIRAFLAESQHSGAPIEEFLNRLIAWRLMIQLDGRYLSLAVRSPGSQIHDSPVSQSKAHPELVVL
jgi:hypothetical protein